MKHVIDGTWTLCAYCDSDSAPLSENAAALPAAIPASVPGDIVGTLLDAGLIPDPYYGRNELDLLWIGRTDWKYSVLFDTDAPAADLKTSALEFARLDTAAEIRLNGTVLGVTQNMFRFYRLDAASSIKSGTNRLEVIIRSPERYTEKRAKQLPYPIPQMSQFPWEWKHRNLLRKVACHGGWDWGITLMTGGICQAPVLRFQNAGYVQKLNVSPQKTSENEWTLDAVCEYYAPEKGETELQYRFDGQTYSSRFQVSPGPNTLRHSIQASDPKLWWPAGQGEPHLYRFTLTTPEETIEKNIGFRTVETVVRDDETGRSMFFRVNGRDIFAKGANWIPTDAIPSRQTPQVYRRLLSDAVSVNMNMIRLWGGGQYEQDFFYEICDELGLMIWHDMMFSCSLYPADSEFLAETEAELRYQIPRLKDHPSIVLWCGNNEDLGALTWFPESVKNRDRYLVDYDRLNEGTVGRVIRELDPQRTFWPSSPSAGEGDYSDCWHDDTKGDMHYWSVWHEGKPFEAYYDVIPRFCSEFGFQSFPSLSLIKKYIPENERNLTAPAMRHHQKHIAGNTTILSTMARYFRIPSDFEDQLYLSQVQQAMAIRTAVDYWRANRPVAMGALYWQLNDNWPVASWSGIDYSGAWKILHHEAARFFAPVRACMYIKDDCLKIILVNDHPEEIRVTLKLEILGFDADVFAEKALTDLNCPAGGVREIFTERLDFLGAAGKRRFDGGPAPLNGVVADVVDERLTDRFAAVHWKFADAPDSADAEISESLFLTAPRDCSLSDPEISIRPGQTPDSVILEARRPTFYVWPETGMPGRFSDGGFTLLPGRPKEIRFIPAGETQLSAPLIDDLILRHLRGMY